jgi:hypothetical protein
MAVRIREQSSQWKRLRSVGFGIQQFMSDFVSCWAVFIHML